MRQQEVAPDQEYREAAGLLEQAAERSRARVERVLSSRAFTLREWTVLQALLDSDGGQTPTQLSILTGLSKPRVSEVLLRLEDRGACKRQRDGTDARRLMIVLSGQGRRDVSQLQPLLEATRADEIGRLAPEQVRVLKDLLASLSDAHIPRVPSPSTATIEGATPCR